MMVNYTMCQNSTLALNPEEFRYLPEEDHANHSHQDACHLLLFGLPCCEAASVPVERRLACSRVVSLIWKRPGHVARISQTAAAECILDGPDSFHLLDPVHILPALVKSAVQA